ncbi:hypothetical protein DPMN_132416 [Dreissena polymorpha]|uniref:Uncharacterized protein n=1 Tax=Dreissena polymorpha TaxID=45954 RepID=A0A9D4FV22_DREPO|nr:hypothetical protein DPMN_132416 [Dreissena polymorpha]
MLQQDIFSMSKWSDKWLLRFHPDKCKTMTISNKKLAERTYKLRPELKPIEISNAEKDIGVTIDD